MPKPKCWAAFVARVLLGLIFFMAGWWKVFGLGPLAHAEGLFVGPYASTFLPEWSLWLSGTLIPFAELVCGGLLLVGWRRSLGAVGVGSVLIVVTFGHLLAEPLYAFDAHVVPRTLLLVVVLALFEHDRWSLDVWLADRKRRE